MSCKQICFPSLNIWTGYERVVIIHNVIYVYNKQNILHTLYVKDTMSHVVIDTGLCVRNDATLAMCILIMRRAWMNISGEKNDTHPTADV